MVSKSKDFTIVVALVVQLFAVASMQKTTVLVSKAPKFHDDAQKMSAFERLDLKLIETFAKQYKLDIEYITANDTLNEMFDTENKLEKLFDSTKGLKIDMFIGALEENLNTKKYLIASRPYYHDCLTWCIQKHQPMPRWQSVFYMCTDWNVYVVLTLFVLFAISVAYYLQKTEPHKKDWHYITLFTLCVGIGYPYSYQPKGNPTRVLFSICRFGGTIFYTVLTSMLLLRVTVPQYMPQISSIAEITKGDFTLAGDRFAFQKISQQNYSAELLQNFEIFNDPNVYLSRLEWDNKLGVAVSREQIRNDETLSQMHIYCFENPNHIYEYPMRVLTTKEFQYLRQMNRFIEVASESGLISKWLKGIQFGQFGEEKSPPKYSEVDMEVIWVLVLIAVILLLFSTYVLYVERAMDKRDKNKSNARIWRIIKMFIDPDRHFLMDDMKYYDMKRTLKP